MSKTELLLTGTSANTLGVEFQQETHLKFLVKVPYWQHASPMHFGPSQKHSG